MAVYTAEKCIEKLGLMVKAKDRMLLRVTGDRVIVESEFFNYEDIQKFTHILQRTSCEWWIYPSEILERGVELRVRLF